MSRHQYHTWREIQSQPEAWAAALDLLRAHAAELRTLAQAGRYDSVIFTGCGSPYYLALAAAATFQELTGRPARGVPASEIWLNPRAALADGGRALLVTLSRSGETTETIRARMMTAFIRSTQYEWLFWDGAYQRRGWPEFV